MCTCSSGTIPRRRDRMKHEKRQRPGEMLFKYLKCQEEWLKYYNNLQQYDNFTRQLNNFVIMVL